MQFNFKCDNTKKFSSSFMKKDVKRNMELPFFSNRNQGMWYSMILRRHNSSPMHSGVKYVFIFVVFTEVLIR